MYAQSAAGGLKNPFHGSSPLVRRAEIQSTHDSLRQFGFERAEGWAAGDLLAVDEQHQSAAALVVLAGFVVDDCQNMAVIRQAVDGEISSTRRREQRMDDDSCCRRAGADR